MLIARLIADPDGLETRLDAATRALEGEGMNVALAQMLDFRGVVLQISLPQGDPGTLRRLLDEHFSPADLLVAEDEIRMPQLFVSDMDSTMIGQECIDELADFAGIKDRVAAITDRAMRGEIDFENALRERVGLLGGLEEQAISTCLAERIEPSPGAGTLVATLKDKGCRTVLVTGGFHHFADPVAERIGFERVVGNRLAVADGLLSGEVSGAVVDSSAKEKVLREETERLGHDTVSLATGDGANDIPLLRTATYGFAWRAKPAAREAAHGWIDRGDLTAILQLLNIPREEWVAG